MRTLRTCQPGRSEVLLRLRCATGCCLCGLWSPAPARREAAQRGRACGHAVAPVTSAAEVRVPRFASPAAYTPKHLAEKILTSRNALEGERKQVTVLFADLKGSMELLADRDPEEARKLLDAVLERM